MGEKAVYAGSFDPFTNGHLYIYEEACKLFDEVHILIARNPNKSRFTDVGQMAADIKKTTGGIVYVTHGLVADYCKEKQISYLVRGLRGTSDYLYEEEIAKVNWMLYPGLQTVYFRAKDDSVSSSLVRLLLEQGKNVSSYVPSRITLPVRGEEL